MTATEGISVCIPTHIGRGHLIPELLDTVVEASTTVSEPVEILVVDDSPTAEATKVERKCDEVGATYLRGPKNVGSKRNLAASHARHDVLFFTDSDCLLTRHALSAHLDAIRQASPDVAGVAGMTRMYGEVTKIWHTIATTQFHNPCFDFAKRYIQVGWGTTANLSVRNDVFHRIGGFCERTFTHVGGEDVDLGIRATKNGYRWITSTAAVVHHRRGPIVNLHDVIQRLFTYGRADVFLTDTHAERRRFHANPYTLGLGLVAAGLLSRGRTRTAAMTAAGLVPTALLLSEALRRCRSPRTAYGDRPHDTHTNKPPGLRDHIKSSLIDSVFDAGLAWEAIRRGKPLSALARFAYVDPRTFVHRRQPRQLDRLPPPRTKGAS